MLNKLNQEKNPEISRVMGLNSSALLTGKIAVQDTLVSIVFTVVP